MELIKEYFESFTPDTWVAQIIGIIALLAGVISYWQRDPRKLAIFQFIMSTCWCIHMFMLNATSGFILNLVAILRQIVILCSKKCKWANLKLWTWIVIVLFVIATAYSYYLTPVWYTIIPLIPMILMTVAFVSNNSTTSRILSLIAGPFWFVYDLLSMSVAGMVNEVICFCSTSVSVVKLDILDRKRDN